MLALLALGAVLRLVMIDIEKKVGLRSRSFGLPNSYLCGARFINEFNSLP